jgi:RNA polymerase sigma-70 factor (family 1)
MSIAINKTNNRSDSEELVQNSFFKFYEQKKSFNSDNSVFAYLYVILKNQILNHYRKQLVHQKYEIHVAKNFSFQEESLTLEIETRELEKQIYAEVEKLPEKCKKVFLLSRKENLTNKEIAERLNISENTVEQHMRKALGRLRNSLANYMELALVIGLLSDTWLD